MSKQAYVDVRGQHPILIDGMVAILLRNAKRDITVDEAYELIRLNRLLEYLPNAEN